MREGQSALLLGSPRIKRQENMMPDLPLAAYEETAP